VGLGDTGDDYHVYVGILEGLVDAAVGFGAGVVFLCVVVGLRRALDDAVDFVDVWEGSDEGDVEDFGAVRRVRYQWVKDIKVVLAHLRP
jgi:hypothetical protein